VISGTDTQHKHEEKSRELVNVKTLRTNSSLTIIVKAISVIYPIQSMVP